MIMALFFSVLCVITLLLFVNKMCIQFFILNLPPRNFLITACYILACEKWDMHINFGENTLEGKARRRPTRRCNDDIKKVIT